MKLDFLNDDKSSLVKNDFLISNYLALAHRELEFYFNNYANIKTTLGISRLEGLYLLLIGHNSGIAQSRISEILHTDLTLISKLTKSLIDKGFIKKFVNIHDKRKKNICLTEKGELIVPYFLDLYIDFNSTFLKGLSLQEKACLENLLIKVFNNVETFKSKYKQSD
ncbi:MAG: MarR family transcriptional regulator [Fusobacteriaceae bacterium]|nr:MarR family transcriptional regulator [Fusobacteriaceae bacterium]